MRRLDHAAIFLFMAAAYTPLCAIALPGRLGRVTLAVVWFATIGGTVLKLFGFDRSQRAGTAMYLLIGWGAVVVLPAAAHILGPTQLALMGVMGALYTGGAMVLFSRRPDPIPHVFGYHEVWHASVVVASACYYVVLWRLVGVGP